MRDRGDLDELDRPGVCSLEVAADVVDAAARLGVGSRCVSRPGQWDGVVGLLSETAQDVEQGDRGRRAVTLFRQAGEPRAQGVAGPAEQEATGGSLQQRAHGAELWQREEVRAEEVVAELGDGGLGVPAPSVISTSSYSA
ncbi:hypothetical protein [Streptomyces sp. NPDC059262]|uniref:hypothetical protein n=1 Tax=Streptomyces sp. NPDC059262 TaxID=3346797 RepID=UPI0036A7E8E3